MSDIQSLVIVGGGTAGWLAACYLQRTLGAARQSPLPITLIEPPQAASIGADLATVPTLRGTMQALGIPERALFTAADATLSNGLRFNGWRRGGAATDDSFDHPFDIPPPFHGFATTAHWLNLLQRGLTQQPMAQACAVQTTLFDGHLSPKLMDSPEYQAPVSYGYQLDGSKLAMLLQQKALERGVRHVQGEVVRVQRGPAGIEAVELADGRRCEASFFIDCTGSRSLLLQQALGVPWVSHADWLPCDRVVSLPVAHGQAHGALRSHTTATAQAAGWSWDMDLQSRRGTGHVYASRFCSDDEAVQIYKPQPKKVPRRRPPLFDNFEDENALTGLAKPLSLPEGVKIVYVRTADDLKPIKEGQASVFFFPGGRTQKTHIVIEDEQNDENAWTIKIEPLTGRVTIVDGREELVLPDDVEDDEDGLGKRHHRRTF